MIDIPVLQSERLRLRGHQTSDFESCAAMWADPLVTRFIGGQPSTTQQTWSRILNYAGLWAHLGFGYWVIEERASGKFIGEVGFADFRRIMDPPLERVPEAGWALVSSAHGNGFATEAVRLIHEWGDQNLSSKRTVCMISPSNTQSIRVAEKIGYQRSHVAQYMGSSTTVFVRG